MRAGLRVCHHVRRLRAPHSWRAAWLSTAADESAASGGQAGPAGGLRPPRAPTPAELMAQADQHLTRLLREGGDVAQGGAGDRTTGVVAAEGEGTLCYAWGLRDATLGSLVALSPAEGGRRRVGMVQALFSDTVAIALLDRHADGQDAETLLGAGVSMIRQRGGIARHPNTMRGRVVDPLGRDIMSVVVSQEPDESQPSQEQEKERAEGPTNPADAEDMAHAAFVLPLHYGAAGAATPPAAACAQASALLYTGTDVVDLFMPLARGGSMLVVGNEGAGKTTFALNAVAAQTLQERQVDLCVYVSIGQSERQLHERLFGAGLLQRLPQELVVVATQPNDALGLHCLAPFTGTAIADYVRQQGKHALVIVDDFGAHATAYGKLTQAMRGNGVRQTAVHHSPVTSLHGQIFGTAAERNEEHGGGSVSVIALIPRSVSPGAGAGGGLHELAESFEKDIVENSAGMADVVVELEAELARERRFPAIDPASVCALPNRFARVQDSELKQIVSNLRVKLAAVKDAQEANTIAKAMGLDLLDDADEELQDILRAPERLQELISATDVESTGVPRATLASASERVRKLAHEFQRVLAAKATGKKKGKTS